MSLADKLVDAAESAIGDVFDPLGFGFEDEARAAVIAVLRGFSDHLGVMATQYGEYVVGVGFAYAAKEAETIAYEVEGRK